MNPTGGLTDPTLNLHKRKIDAVEEPATQAIDELEPNEMAAKDPAQLDQEIRELFISAFRLYEDLEEISEGVFKRRQQEQLDIKLAELKSKDEEIQEYLLAAQADSVEGKVIISRLSIWHVMSSKLIASTLSLRSICLKTLFTIDENFKDLPYRLNLKVYRLVQSKNGITYRVSDPVLRLYVYTVLTTPALGPLAKESIIAFISDQYCPKSRFTISLEAFGGKVKYELHYCSCNHLIELCSKHWTKCLMDGTDKVKLDFSELLSPIVKVSPIAGKEARFAFMIPENYQEMPRNCQALKIIELLKGEDCRKMLASYEEMDFPSHGILIEMPHPNPADKDKFDTMQLPPESLQQAVDLGRKYKSTFYCWFTSFSRTEQESLKKKLLQILAELIQIIPLTSLASDIQFYHFLTRSTNYYDPIKISVSSDQGVRQEAELNFESDLAPAAFLVKVLFHNWEHSACGGILQQFLGKILEEYIPMSLIESRVVNPESKSWDAILQEGFFHSLIDVSIKIADGKEIQFKETLAEIFQGANAFAKEGRSCIDHYSRLLEIRKVINMFCLRSQRKVNLKVEDCEEPNVLKRLQQAIALYPKFNKKSPQHIVSKEQVLEVFKYIMAQVGLESPFIAKHFAPLPGFHHIALDLQTLNLPPLTRIGPVFSLLDANRGIKVGILFQALLGSRGFKEKVGSMKDADSQLVNFIKTIESGQDRDITLSYQELIRTLNTPENAKLIASHPEVMQSVLYLDWIIKHVKGQVTENVTFKGISDTQVLTYQAIRYQSSLSIPMRPDEKNRYSLESLLHGYCHEYCTDPAKPWSPHPSRTVKISPYRLMRSFEEKDLSFLVIQLQRFYHSSWGKWSIDSAISFPENDMLNLAPYCSDTSKTSLFKLVGVVVSEDTDAVNHKAYTFRDGCWYLIAPDGPISQVEYSQVEKEKAHILIFDRMKV